MGAAPCQHLASFFGCHALTKAVAALTYQSARLISTLHSKSPGLQSMPKGAVLLCGEYRTVNGSGSTIPLPRSGEKSVDGDHCDAVDAAFGHDQPLAVFGGHHV